MSTIAEIMSTDVQVVGPDDTLQRAAQLMDELNVGSLPVCDGKHLLGMVTDRDITIRGTAMNLAADQARVSAVMTSALEFCTDDQDAQEVLLLMGKAQVRRLPVINVERQLVGIVSIGDLATRQPGPVDAAVSAISAPSQANADTPNS